MDLQALANFGEFLGGVGVIVSLIYLAVQIRGNTSSQRSENYARSLERMASMQQVLSRDARLTEVMNLGLSDPSQLTTTQKSQFVWMMYEFFGALEFMFFQAEQRAIPADLWGRWEGVLKWWLTFPGVQACWKSRPTPYMPAFTKCVERCIAQGYQPENPGAWEAFMSAGQTDRE